MKKLFLLLITVVSFLPMGCSDDSAESVTGLTVQTQEPVITDLLATLGGSFSNPGNVAIIETGVVISDIQNPTIDNTDNLILAITASGTTFTDTYSGFETFAGMTLYVRAYVKTADGVTYGDNKVFVAPGTEGCPVEIVTPDNIAANITSPTIWTADKVYVVTANVTVTSTLTIQPGTIIKMANATLRVNGSGSINATGSASARITFTSLADDSYCGDTNGDGSATTPQKGDWTSVYLNGGNNVFKYCDFLYAGKYDSGYNNCILISVSGAVFNFDNCTFAHTLGNTGSDTSFAFYAGSYMADPSVSQFTNNVFYDNDRPIYLNIYYSLNPNNSFHNPANPSQGNARNGIWTWNTTNQGATVNFNVSEVPYVLSDFFNGGGSGATDTVNIGPGVILKFLGQDAGISRGPSRAVNIDGSAIFTSFRDDANGGDTNGDGNATSPANNDWDGYYNYSNTSYISGAYILYDSH